MSFTYLELPEKYFRLDGNSRESYFTIDVLVRVTLDGKIPTLTLAMDILCLSFEKKAKSRNILFMKRRDMEVYDITFRQLLNEKYFLIKNLEPTTSGPSSSNDEATSNIKRRSPTISPDPYRGYDSGTHIII